jgi:hypothetical protein
VEVLAMRLTGLLAALLFLLIVFFAAPAASHAQTVNSPAVKTDRTGSEPGSTPLDAMQLDPNRLQSHQTVHELHLAQPLLEYGGDLVVRDTPENDGLCYTMRTYVMAREDKTSDATHLVCEAKCTPARKFQFKTTDQHTGPWADGNNLRK